LSVSLLLPLLKGVASPAAMHLDLRVLGVCSAGCWVLPQEFTPTEQEPTSAVPLWASVGICVFTWNWKAKLPAS
jgi:hypothetical protein